MKKSILGMLAVILVIGFSAFIKKNATSVYNGEKWFHFVGSNNIPGDLTDPDMYELDNGTGAAPTVCPSASTYRCEIKIMPQSGDPSKPDLSGHSVIDETGRTTP